MVAIMRNWELSFEIDGRFIYEFHGRPFTSPRRVDNREHRSSAAGVPALPGRFPEEAASLRLRTLVRRKIRPRVFVAG
jgi:hypothetical protein